MHSIKGLLVASLGCVGKLFSITSQNIHQTADDIGNWANLQASEVVIAVPREFKSALSSIPTETLHSVLHQHLPNFKDGIFEKDHKAVEEIYKRSPDMANKLVAAARYDVLRRQNGNITQSSRAPVTTTTPITLTQTNAQGSVYLTTVTPVGGVYTSQFIRTTTLADGSRSTYTSLTIVPAPTSGTQQGGPSLQGDASSIRGSVTLQGVLVLALSFAGFLLV